MTDIHVIKTMSRTLKHTRWLYNGFNLFGVAYAFSNPFLDKASIVWLHAIVCASCLLFHASFSSLAQRTYSAYISISISLFMLKMWVILMAIFFTTQSISSETMTLLGLSVLMHIIYDIIVDTASNTGFIDDLQDYLPFARRNIIDWQQVTQQETEVIVQV